MDDVSGGVIAEASATSNGGKAGEVFYHHDGYEVVQPAPWCAKASASLMKPGRGNIRVRMDDLADGDEGEAQVSRAIRRALQSVRLMARLDGVDLEVQVRKGFDDGSVIARWSDPIRCAIRATLNLFGDEISDHALNQIAVSIGGPIDPDLDRYLLWDSQHAIELSDRFPIPACSMVIATPRGIAIDTPTVRAAAPGYTRWEQWCLGANRQELLGALRDANRARIAALSTLSLQINQNYLPKPEFDPLFHSLPPDVGLIGAHSGTLIGAFGGPDNLGNLCAWFTGVLRGISEVNRRSYDIISFVHDGNGSISNARPRSLWIGGRE